MKTPILLAILFAIPFCNESNAQNHPLIERCGFDRYVSHQKALNADYDQVYQEVLRTWKQTGNLKGDGTYVLPVVFHVVYNMEGQNLPDSVIHSQLEVINEDYRRMNADAVDTREIFIPFASDCGIEFELAQTDPQGNSTTGITRTYTDRAGFNLDFFSSTNTLDEVKSATTGGVDAWDPEHYINIWICNIEASDFGQIFGLSYPPNGAANWPAGSFAPTPEVQGIVLHYTTVGRNNPVATDDGFEGNELGRTLSHEMGHYLGLRHTWGDATPFFQNGCSVDDGISDTPNTSTGDQFQCDFTSNSCESDLDGDLPDMIENFMDYTPDVCLNMFTEEQRSMMRFVIENFRPALLDGVNVQEFSVENKWTIYPVPAQDQITIEGEIKDKTQWFIADALGQIVLQGQINLQATTLSIQTLSKGIYFLRMGSSVKRFVKQ